MRFSEANARELVRSLAAYLKAAPVSELPTSIRRFRTFRTASLWPHRDRLLQAVDENEELRASILRWLEEDEPRLGLQAERRLRQFVERAEGWEQELLASGSEKSTQAPAPAGAPARQETSRDYKSEVRRLQAEMRATARTHASAAAAQRQRIEELERRVEVAEAAVAASSEAAAAQAQDQERRARRLQRSAQQATAERDRALTELKALRRELRRETRRADEAEGALRATTPPAGEEYRRVGSKPRAAPRSRRALAVPHGLLEDDPATLARWLQEPSVRLLVDGYNVAKQDGAFKSLSAEDQRARTVDEVTRLVRRHGVEATVVFDGAEVAPGTSRSRRGPVRVEYSRPPEIGDDHLVKLLESWPPVPVIVATSDKGLQERCRALGSTIATSGQLLAAVR